MRKSHPKKWNLSDLPNAVKESTCYAEVIRKLGLGNISGNYKTIKKYISSLKIDVSHFNDERMRSGLKTHLNSIRHSVETALIEDSTAAQHIVKRIFLKLVPYLCVLCRNEGTHNGLPLVLQMDHANGNRKDCRKENLRLLCPNCHTQTETFGNKTR